MHKVGAFLGDPTIRVPSGSSNMTSGVEKLSFLAVARERKRP